MYVETQYILPSHIKRLTTIKQTDIKSYQTPSRAKESNYIYSCSIVLKPSWMRSYCLLATRTLYLCSMMRHTRAFCFHSANEYLENEIACLPISTSLTGDCARFLIGRGLLLEFRLKGINNPCSKAKTLLWQCHVHYVVWEWRICIYEFM